MIEVSSTTTRLPDHRILFSSLIHNLEGRWSGKNVRKVDTGGYFYKTTQNKL